MLLGAQLESPSPVAARRVVDREHSDIWGTLLLTLHIQPEKERFHSKCFAQRRLMGSFRTAKDLRKGGPANHRSSAGLRFHTAARLGG